MLLDREKTALAVIDIQQVLLPKSEEVTAAYLRAAVRMIRAAKVLGLPLLVTEQNPGRLGGTHPEVLPELGDAPRIPKIEFGCLANPAFRAALEASGRTQLLIIGMEAHVCVNQTALEALERGFEVFVAEDAVVSSTPEARAAGLRRMERAGAALLTVDMAVFELLRRAGTPEFKAMLPMLKGD